MQLKVPFYLQGGLIVPEKKDKQTDVLERYLTLSHNR